MSLSNLASLTRWTAGLALALGLHAAVALVLVTQWHAKAADVAGGPAILVVLSSAPAAPAVTPTALPPTPQPSQQLVQPERKPPRLKQQAQPKQQTPPKPAIAKIAPVTTTSAVTTMTPVTPKTPEMAVMPMPPPRPAAARRPDKPHPRHASRAGAPARAAHHSRRIAALAPGAATHDPDAVPDWRSAVVAQIERHKHYPAAALAHGTHGVAEVGFSVDRRGGVHNIRILRSSGSALLDRDALAWLRRSQPLPPPPVEMRGTRIPVVVPLRYDIR